MSDELTQRLSHCYTGVLHDVMRARGMRDFTLPRELRPIFPDRVLAGPAFTVSGHVDTGADAHATLLEWTGLLSKARPGHVWVSQPNDDTVAHMGELSAETLMRKGVLGAIADGAVRDVGFLLEMGFQTWSRGYTPRDIVGYWLPDGVDVPIRIGETTIRPGDYVCGDRDGVVVLPRETAAEIVAEGEKAIGTENLVRSAILEGMDPQQAYLKHSKF